MKILIDENLPIQLKKYLPENSAYTVYDMNWTSFKNGKLLKYAEENGFDLFITTDKNLQYQQNLKNLSISIIVLNIVLLKWLHIEPLIPEILKLLPIIEKGNIYIIE